MIIYDIPKNKLFSFVVVSINPISKSQRGGDVQKRYTADFEAQGSKLSFENIKFKVTPQR